MTRLNNNFLGDPPSQIRAWSGGDEEDAYLKNCATQPLDWYYRDLKIEYSFNSNGHRCKEIDDIDLSNYLLFSGCSNTVGVGLELEKTYPHVVSKKLGCDYYNIAISGTGIDAVAFNIITWINVNKQAPRAIIIQVPEITRVLIADGGENFDAAGPWTKNRDLQTFISAGDEVGFFLARITLFKKLLLNISPCPIYFYEVHPCNLTPGSLVIDTARDMRHPGINCQIAYAEMICSDLDPLFN